MARASLTIGALLAVMLLLSSVNAAGVIKKAPINMPAHMGIAPHRYIVEFTATPALVKAVGVKSIQTINTQHAQFRAAAQAHNIHFEERRSFTDLYNGMSVKVTSDADVARLAKLPGVKAIHPVVTYKLPPRQSLIPRIDDHNKPQLRFAHNMTNVNKVHLDLGLKGKGIKIGIIDTGIDFMHPAFAEPGKTCTSFKGDGCRVKYGQDFAGDDFNGVSQPVPHPGPTPMDCAGHGTHVSGIAGGFDGNITGVAPEATFGAYRVFGCGEGSTSGDLMIAAMEQAYKDGMDVVNLSIGGGSSFAELPDAVVASRLTELGMMVQSALGNDGTEHNLFWSSAPGVAANAFGVGSFDNIMGMDGSFHFSNLDGMTDTYQFSPDNTAPAWPIGKEIPLVANNKDTTVKDDGCTAFPAGKFAGQVALIRRGTCLFAIKAQNAIDAGAVGVVIYNNQPGALNPSVPGLKAPLALIPAEAGEAAVAAFFAGKKPALVVDAGQRGWKLPTGGLPSDFSSWGVAPDLAIKPDIAAPGGWIFSSVPRSMGYYDVYSGTSMATPYFTGCVALWIEQNKGISRADRKFVQIKGRAQNAGKPVEQVAGLAWSVNKQGPGLIDALQFVQPSASVMPSSIALKDVFGANKRRNVKLTVSNHGPAQTFTFSHQPAVAVSSINVTIGAIAPSFSGEVARVTFGQPSIQLAQNAQADVAVTINLESANLSDDEFWQLSGYIVVSGDKSLNTTDVHVPYHAMKGDYSQYPIVADPLGAGAPLLSDLTLVHPVNGTNPPMHNLPTDEVTFSLNDTDVPVVLVNTVHVTRLFSINVYDNKTDKFLGYIMQQEFMPPTQLILPSFPITNSSGLPDTGYGWDTSVYADLTANQTTLLGDGVYYWKVQVVAPSSGPAPDDSNKALVDAWRSPVMIIKSGKATPTQPPTTTTTATPTPTATSTPPPPPKYHHGPAPTPKPTPPPPPKYHHGSAAPAPPTRVGTQVISIPRAGPIRNKPSLPVMRSNV
ncbi:hypothetical protein RI367_004697 [Sorochytrium milnesiophthora]